MTSLLIEPLIAYEDLTEGTLLPPLDVCVDAARQRHYHATTDVAGAAFGEFADISILAQDNVQATNAAGLPTDGRIHMGHRIVQHRPVRLGERLRMQGQVLPYREIPRGRVLCCAFDVSDAAGRPVLRMLPEYLLSYREPAAAGPKPARAPAPDTAGWREAGTLRLTPEKVAGFSGEVGNRIHFDPDFARARGYRAPLAQGLMALTALHGALVQYGVPESLDMQIAFQRPMFWDSQLSIRSSPDHNTLVSLDESGHISATLIVAELTRRELRS